MFTFGVPQDYSIHFLCVLSDRQGSGQVQSGPSPSLSLKVKTLVQAILLSKDYPPYSFQLSSSSSHSTISSTRVISINRNLSKIPSPPTNIQMHRVFCLSGGEIRVWTLVLEGVVIGRKGFSRFGRGLTEQDIGERNGSQESFQVIDSIKRKRRAVGSILGFLKLGEKGTMEEN